MAAAASTTDINENEIVDSEVEVKSVVEERAANSEPGASENIANNEPDNPLMPGDELQPAGLITESGEINWDCPCLQGMADGPCGTEFKDAFSCFHYSEEVPKGADCIEPFTAMQKCFLQYPEVYGGIDDDEEEESPAAESEVKEESENVPEENIPEERSEAATENAVTEEKIENVTQKLENTSLPNS